jgi:hypothetical protein
MDNQQSEKSILHVDDSADPSIPQIKKDTNNPAPVEIGGPKGPEPTRYGDWEKAGRCTDF